MKAAGASFPDVLQTRGLYQLKPDPPFVPGSEVADSHLAPADSGLKEGERVMAFTVLAAWPSGLGAGLPHLRPAGTARFRARGVGDPQLPHRVFRLEAEGRLQEGERVLVHGAAGGVGTAALQVAKALDASTIAVVSSDEKERVARRPERTRSCARMGLGVSRRSSWAAWTWCDPVGGDRSTDSLRCLREDDGARGGLHRGPDPRGQGQSPAAAQRVGRGGRVGCLCDGQSVSQQSDRRGHRGDDRPGVHLADSWGVRTARAGRWRVPDTTGVVPGQARARPRLRGVRKERPGRSARPQGYACVWELGYAMSVWPSGRDDREGRVAFVEQPQKLAQLDPVACHRDCAARKS